MQKDIDEIKSDVKEIKNQVIELVAETRVHNHILNEHHKRSTNLENRLEPVEDHVKFINKSIKVFGTICAASGLITIILQLLRIL